MSPLGDKGSYDIGNGGGDGRGEKDVLRGCYHTFSMCLSYCL